MGMRRSIRRAAWALAALVVAAAAVAVGRQAIELVSQRDARRQGHAVGAAVGGAEARLSDSLDRGRMPRVRERARASAIVEDEAAAAADPESARRDAADESAPEPRLHAGDVGEWVQMVDPAGFKLPAEPDRDPGTGEAAPVAPGRPREVEFAAFVERGAEAVDRVAELVGERRPQLDEGVPISLSGRVVEADGGAAVAGARVVVSSIFYVRRYFYDHHLREVARVETDADGAYVIERLNVDPVHFGEAGRLYVTVTADGHAPALAVPIANLSPGVANRLREIALRRATQTLRGRVVDYWEGLPVVGARVIATGAVVPITYPKDERAALFVGAPSDVTDDDGGFVLEGLGDGVQTISVHGGDDCVGWSQVVLPHDGEFAVQTRQIRGRVEGRTIDERGAPVPLVLVEGGGNSTHSFADGRFVLENFRGDAVTIRFTHPDHPPVVLADVRDGTAGLLVRVGRARPEIVLDVREKATSAPVTRVRLAFAFEDGRVRPAATSPHHVAADGRHPVRIPEGATSVSVSADGRRREHVSLVGRADGDVVFVLLAPESEK